MRRRVKLPERVEHEVTYVQCELRKGTPRVHVKVCRLCTEECPERRKVVRFAKSSKEGGEKKKVNSERKEIEQEGEKNG